MSPWRSRRSVLAAAGTALSAGLGGCSRLPVVGGGLPYEAPGAERTYTASTAEFRNESDRGVSLRVGVAHGSDLFFDREYDLAPGERATVEELTATAGEFAVTAELADGTGTSYDWRIPPSYNWPKLLVVVRSNEAVLAGCGSGGSLSVGVENASERERSVDLVLRRDGDRTVGRTATVSPGESRDVALPVPIGDVYALEATTDGGTASAEVWDCYCYFAQRATVTLDGDGPAVESTTAVCD